MLAHERGSSSVLFIGVVFPIAALFLALSFELQQYFGVREEVQQLVDKHSRLDVSRSWDSTFVAEKLKKDLVALEPYLHVEGVTHRREGGSSSVAISGLFQGMFTKAFAAFVGGRWSLGLPLSVYATARRPRAAVLVAVDRTIEEGEAECDNPSLIAREQVAGRLIVAMNESEMPSRFGTFPAGDEGIVILGPRFDDSTILCSAATGDVSEGEYALRGVSSRSEKSIESVLGVVSASLRGAGGSELSTLVVVTRNDGQGSQFILDAASIIASEPLATVRKTKVIGFVVGDSTRGLREIWRGSVSGIDLRIIPVVGSGEVEPLIEAAFVQDLTSRVVLVR